MLGVARILPPEGRNILLEGYKKLKEEPKKAKGLDVLEKHIQIVKQKFPQFFVLTKEEKMRIYMQKERFDVEEKLASAIHLLRKGFSVDTASKSVGLSADLILSVFERRKR